MPSLKICIYVLASCKLSRFICCWDCWYLWYITTIPSGFPFLHRPRQGNWCYRSLTLVYCTIIASAWVNCQKMYHGTGCRIQNSPQLMCEHFFHNEQHRCVVSREAATPAQVVTWYAKRSGSNSGGESCSIFYLKLSGGAALIRKIGLGETAISTLSSHL